jgi:hypothetical protein
VNTDEELLTRALDRAAGRITAGTLRPLTEPETAPPRRRRARRAGWNAWLAPLGAAVAVVLVAAAVLLATGTHRPGTAPAASAPGAAGPPRYYAEVEGKFNGWHGRDAVEVVVRSTATGAVAARVPNPAIPGASRVLPQSVAAGPDGRTFYAAYINWGRKPSDFRIYRFRITASGTATRPVPVKGGTVAGQADIGGFAVSPDGSRLAMAVTVTGGSDGSSVASEITILDLRTGARAVWRGGMDRPGQAFGIEDLSWTGDSKSLAYLGAWCPPRGISDGFYGGFICSTMANNGKYIKGLGTDAVREIRLAPGGGTLSSGRVLRAPAPAAGPLPVLITPDGKELITLAESSSGYNVVKTSVATGRVVSVLGAVPSLELPSLQPLFAGEYLAADRTGRYVLVWMAGNSTTGHPLHGWVHGGQYHQLAPTFPGSYPGGWIQMTW